VGARDHLYVYEFDERRNKSKLPGCLRKSIFWRLGKRKHEAMTLLR
jgi:hypothetical protein